ncbi:hypothetical protein ACFQ51_03105 [Streptomyces kaempferi]
MIPTPAEKSPLSLLRDHLGWAVGAAYLAAATVSAPGLWLRRPHTIGDGGFLEVALRTPHFLLSLVLFTAASRCRSTNCGLC